MDLYEVHVSNYSWLVLDIAEGLQKVMFFDDSWLDKHVMLDWTGRLNRILALGGASQFIEQAYVVNLGTEVYQVMNEQRIDRESAALSWLLEHRPERLRSHPERRPAYVQNGHGGLETPKATRTPGA